MRSSSHCGGLLFALSISITLTVLLPSASGQQPSQLQCPVAQLRILPNGSVVFDPLPAGADFVQPTVDTGPASGWYALAAGFVDVVRPGSLPYDQIRTSLTDTGVQCSLTGDTGCGGDGEEGGQFDVQQTLTSFATWWIGILIVTLIGGIGAIIFAITGMCFCCCRCCGKCGGSKTQEIGENMDCKTFSFTIVLLFLLAILFAGVVLAFFSNQQTFDSVANANTSINNVITDGVQYIDDTITELEQIVCQLAGGQGVAVEVVDEARQFSGSLQTYVNDLEGEVESIYGNIDTLSPSYNTTIDTLRNITTTTTALVTSGNTLSNSLSIITNSLMMVRDSCSAPLPCSDIPDPALFQKGADFTEVPNVDTQLNDITNAINDINFDSLVDQGRQTFNDIRSSINDTVSGNVDETLNQVLQYNDTLFGFIDNITGTVREYIDDAPQECEDLISDFGNLQLNVGFIRRCIIIAAFNEIEEFDVYRYAFGVVICSLALVTIVVALLGVAMGIFGFRKNKDPDQRTKLSHCGGICLVLDVVLTFIFGFVLLVLCCIFFFFGSNAQKLCQSIEAPEYPLFTELIDNASYWGGQSLPARYFPSEDAQISISGVLNMCSDDAGVFQAANLSNLLPAGSISGEVSSILNLNELRATINGSIANATRDFTFNQTSFLPDDVQNSLEEIRNSSVDQINITAFRTQINAPLVMFNISEQIGILMTLSSNLAMIGTTDALDAQVLVDNATNELINIRDVQIPAIQGQVNSLDASVNGLESQIDTVISDTVGLVDTINSVIQNITGQSLPRFLDENVNGALNRVFTLLDQSIDHVDTEISMNVGACQPLYGIYLQLYNSVCEDFLQGLNGFWWSLGFCALLFIPIIVFLVLTSNYYLRKASATEATAGYSSYEDYPMKSY